MNVEDALSGFLLGLGLILAIGAQNVFVLQQGLKRSHVFTVCITSAVSDAILISIGIAGFHLIEDVASWTTSLLLAVGASFLIVYGGLSAYRAVSRKHKRTLDTISTMSRSKAFLVCLAFIWLNPHVYLDTVFLIGAVSIQHVSQLSFALGAIIASFVFFFTLGYGARNASHLFQSENAWRVLDALVAVIMWALAARLILSA